MKGRSLTASVFILSNLFASPLYANFLVNGSFESPTVPAGTYAVVTPDGWIDGSVIFNMSPPGLLGGTWPLAQHGNQYEDIGNESDTAIQQEFNITTAGLYKLAWFENTALTVSGYVSPYAVSILDSQLAVVAMNDTFDASNNGIWHEKTLSSLLAPGLYTVEFKSLGVQGGADTLIDNVSLTAVPEPTSLLVFAVVIACMAGWMRR